MVRSGTREGVATYNHRVSRGNRANANSHQPRYETCLFVTDALGDDKWMAAIFLGGGYNNRFYDEDMGAETALMRKFSIIYYVHMMCCVHL